MYDRFLGLQKSTQRYNEFSAVWQSQQYICICINANGSQSQSQSQSEGTSWKQLVRCGG